jgi:uncharacterized protein
MLFEWDEAKSRRTLSERGFGFDYATRIFSGLTLEKQDDRRDYGETRMQAIGQAGVDILLLSTPIAATYVTSYLRGSRAARNG